MITLICKNCNKKYLTYPYWKKKGRKYCSRKCRDKSYRGSGNPKWRGGEILVKGYKYVYKPEHPNSTKSGYVKKSHLVMEEHLGRFIKKGEIVHHINRDITDDSPNNLMVCDSAGTHFISQHFQSRDPEGRFKRL